MFNMRIARHAMCLAVLAGASACAGSNEPSYPIPDDAGIYALTDDGYLDRLDGDSDWEAETWEDRSDMPSNVQFVISDPALAGRSAGSSVELWRVAWVRSDINAQNEAMPVAGSQWMVAPIESFSVPFRYESPEGQTDIVHIVPTVPLEPGLYTLRITDPGGRQGRIGVGWNKVDQRRYAAANCVDHYQEGNTYRACTGAGSAEAGALASSGAGYPDDANNPGVTETGPAGGLGSLSAPQPAPSVTSAPTPAPVPTAAQPVPAASTSQGLQIALDNPVRQGDGLLIQGSVVNNSGQVQAVPTMQGSLENDAGEEVRRWVFQPPVATLQPGERANFRTEVHPLPSGVARASVAFIAAQ